MNTQIIRSYSNTDYDCPQENHTRGELLEDLKECDDDSSFKIIIKVLCILNNKTTTTSYKK